MRYNALQAAPVLASIRQTNCHVGNRANGSSFLGIVLNPSFHLLVKPDLAIGTRH